MRSHCPSPSCVPLVAIDQRSSGWEGSGCAFVRDRLGLFKVDSRIQLPQVSISPVHRPALTFSLVAFCCVKMSVFGNLTVCFYDLVVVFYDLVVDFWKMTVFRAEIIWAIFIFFRNFAR